MYFCFMLKAFKEFITKESLFTNNDKILLAVSAGMDSVVMCELFYRGKYNFGIAHGNFQLRSEESNQDESFVRDLASEYKVPFYCKKFATQQYADQNSVSIQMAARTLRYDWFNTVLKEEGFDYVATAHHLDDQIETFFINMLRGTGISGFHGILPKQNKKIHPLLFVYRKDIEKYIFDNNMKFREDSSNKELKYVRNKIRHNLIPVLKDINPNYNSILNQNIKRIRESEYIYREQIDNIRSRIIKHEGKTVVIDIAEIKKLHPLKSYLFELIAPYRFNFSTVEDIISKLDDISGKEFLSKTHRLIKDRNRLIIVEKEKTTTVQHQAKEYYIQENTSSIDHPIVLKFNKLTFNRNLEIYTEQHYANLDFDKLNFPLRIEKWEKGDYFYPLGMNKRKKLSDFFIDNKLTLIEKENTWLLCSGKNIVWIIGHRIDHRYRVTNKTKMVYQITHVY